MARKPETKVVKAIIKMLKTTFPGLYFKTHGGPFQRVGLPDIMGLYCGRFIGIEVKCPGKEDTLTKIQRETLRQIRIFGGVGFMSTSPEQTKKLLKEEMKSWQTSSSKNSRQSTKRRKLSTQREMRSMETVSPEPSRSVVRLQF